MSPNAPGGFTLDRNGPQVIAQGHGGHEWASQSGAGPANTLVFVDRTQTAPLNGADDMGGARDYPGRESLELDAVEFPPDPLRPGPRPRPAGPAGALLTRIRVAAQRGSVSNSRRRRGSWRTARAVFPPGSQRGQLPVASQEVVERAGLSMTCKGECSSADTWRMKSSSRARPAGRRWLGGSACWRFRPRASDPPRRPARRRPRPAASCRSPTGGGLGGPAHRGTLDQPTHAVQIDYVGPGSAGGRTPRG